EPDDQEAPDEHESSPPEDAPLYPHSSGSHYQQNFLIFHCEECNQSDFEIDHMVVSGIYYEQCILLRKLFLLKDGQLWLCAPQAKQIWKCLAENAVYVCDREACFKWYSKLMGDEPDLDPDINKEFFESNVLQLDPFLLTENGMKCFERFFKAVNCREGKLVTKRRAYMMDDLELIGLDYLWRVVIQSNDDIASRAIDLLKEIYTNLGPRLQVNQVVIHEDFIQSCFDRLKASYDTLCVLDGDKDSINCTKQEAVRMVRVLTVLREYINECDSDYHEERTILPMSRAFRGKHLSLIVRFPNHGRQVDDLDIWSHTNDTVGSVRRCILNRIKANVAHTKIELFVGGELIDSEDDRKLIGQLNLKDKSIITAKLTQVSCNMPSSPDSSSDSSTGSPGNYCKRYSDGPKQEVESCLPGVSLVMIMMTVFMTIHACRPDVMRSKMYDTVVKGFNTRPLDHELLCCRSSFQAVNGGTPHDLVLG
ncbi:TPA: Y-linked ubiquitin-specific protease 9-like, partial [Bos taurus]